jgi:hypothetical protein
MSTRINVTVGDGGLLDRNAQQTAANRQAKVLADRRAAAEAEGVERRAADRIAAGLDPLTGLPASTPSSASTINRLDQEPAANRRDDVGVLLEPKQGYFNYGGTLTGVSSRARGLGLNPVFSRFEFESADVVFPWGKNYPEMDFLPGGGPTTTSNSLRVATPVLFPPLEPTPYSAPPPPVSQPFPPDYPLYEPQTAQFAFYQTGLVYAVAKPYDTVLDWQYSFASPDPERVYQVLDLEGQLVEAVPAKERFRVGNVKSCTHEFYVQHADRELESENFLRQRSVEFEEGRVRDGYTSSIQMSVEGLLISSSLVHTYRLESSTNYAVQYEDGDVRTVTAYATDPEYAYRVSLGSGGVTPVASSGYFGTSVIGDNNYDPLLPSIPTGQEWVHIALTRRPVPDTTRFSYELFVNGRRVAQNILTGQLWDSTYRRQPVSARIIARTQRSDIYPGGPYLPSFHGYRFTPKVLYNGETFTPPPEITRLV